MSPELSWIFFQGPLSYITADPKASVPNVVLTSQICSSAMLLLLLIRRIRKIAKIDY